MGQGSQVSHEVSFDVEVQACTSLEKDSEETVIVAYEQGFGPVEQIVAKKNLSCSNSQLYMGTEEYESLQDIVFVPIDISIEDSNFWGGGWLN